jgi:methionine-rich copper-binding protein CopC
MTRTCPGRLGSLVVVLVASEMALAAPASAHTQLTGMQPAADSTVAVPPTTVVLTFDDPVQPGFALVTLTGPDGRQIDDGPPTVAATTVTESVAGRPIDGRSVDGRYAVAYRVVSSDGHPVSGELSFSVAAPAVVSSEAATASPSPPPSPAPAAPTTVPPAPAAATSSVTDHSVTDKHGDGLGWAAAVAAATAAAVAAAAAFLLSKRRTRR